MNAPSDNALEQRKRITATLSGPTLVAFAKRLDADPEMSADRLACQLIGQAFETQPDAPVLAEIKVLAKDSRRRDLGLVAVFIILIALAECAHWAAFRPAMVDLGPLQSELRALRQTVEAQSKLGPKVAELAKRVDVQDRAFVAVLDRLQPEKP